MILKLDNKGHAWAALRMRNIAPETLTNAARAQLLLAIERGEELQPRESRGGFQFRSGWYADICEIYARQHAQKDDGHGRD